MATAGTWREHPFVRGAKYRVIKDCAYLNFRFIAGSIVEFDSSGYERYDSTSLFRFYQKRSILGKREELIWSLNDDEPDSKIRDYFAGPLENK